MRWSQESVSSITVLTLTSPSRTTGRGVISPTARIAACGGLITAPKRLIPYIPRVDTADLPGDSSRVVLAAVAALALGPRRLWLALRLALGLLLLFGLRLVLLALLGLGLLLALGL